jgi:hypothetical protein
MDDQLKINKDKLEEIERCQKLIQSRNPRDRSYAAKRLGEIKARPDILMSLLEDPNGFVRSAAAEALGVPWNCPPLRWFHICWQPSMTLIITCVLQRSIHWGY